MKPRKILLIRHGQSEGNVDTRMYIKKKDKDLALTQEGMDQAISCGYELNKIVDESDYVDFRVSTHTRTRQTFEGINKVFNPLIVRNVEYDPRLVEHHWGSFKNERQYKECIMGFTADPMEYKYHNGESTVEATERVISYQKELFESFENNNVTAPYVVVIVTHGQAINMFLKGMYGFDYDTMLEYKYVRNCEMVVNDLEDDKYVLKTDMVYRRRY